MSTNKRFTVFTGNDSARERSSLSAKLPVPTRRQLFPSHANVGKKQARTRAAACRLAATSVADNPARSPKKSQRLMRRRASILSQIHPWPLLPLPAQPAPLLETLGPNVPTPPRPRRVMRRTATTHLLPTPPAKPRPPASHSAARSAPHLRDKMAPSPPPRSPSRRQPKRGKGRRVTVRLRPTLRAISGIFPPSPRMERLVDPRMPASVYSWRLGSTKGPLAARGTFLVRRRTRKRRRKRQSRSSGTTSDSCYHC